MQFKHPEILYFLFLLVIPILVHLFQLRRFKKEYFTNVRFLKELSIQTRKSSKLKKWLLLATRLLLLAAIIIAFAQPFFNAKDHKNITNEMYIVLDNSFSMQAKGQKGELMRRAIEDLLEHTPENQQFSLLTNTESFWNTDIKSIRRDLQNLKYSAAPFRLETQMAKIKARKSAFNKDVVIIGDVIGTEPESLKSIDPDFNTYFIVPEAEQRNNVSADSVYIAQTMDNFYEIGVKLSAYGESIKDVSVALYDKEKLVAKTSVSFETKTKDIRFTIPKADFHGYVSVNDNGLQYDNNLYFSISKPAKANVLSIGETAKSGFLSKIYTAGEFSYSNYELSGLDYNLLEKQDAIVLNEPEDIPQALQTTLKSFVEKGGNLVIIPSEKTQTPTLNTFLASFGIRLNPIQENKKLITKIAFGHPLYATVFEKKIENFQYPETKKSFAIGGRAPVVLGYEDQSAFLTAIGNSVSSVYVFAAPINKENSNFQNSPLIVPTFYNMAQNSGKTGVTAITIGKNQPMLIDAPLSKDEILEIRNKDEKFIPVQQILSSKVRLAFGDYPQQAGNFGVYNGQEIVRNVSFNYDRTEGNLTAPDSGMLSDYKTITDVETVFNTLLTDRTDNLVWKWFVVLALIFLVTELLIQKFVK
jgi:hypothetical protein